MNIVSCRYARCPTCRCPSSSSRHCRRACGRLSHSPPIRAVYASANKKSSCSERYTVCYVCLWCSFERMWVFIRILWRKCGVIVWCRRSTTHRPPKRRNTSSKRCSTKRICVRWHWRRVLFRGIMIILYTISYLFCVNVC